MRHKKINVNREGKMSGFTLIEIILYTAISSIILLTISVFFQFTLQAKVKNQTIAEVEQQGAQVMQVITQAIRNSQGVDSPSPGSNSSTLSLDIADANDDPTVFSLSGDTVNITEGASSAVNLTNGRAIVSGLSFDNLSRSGTPGIIRIQFTVTHLNPSGKNEFDYSKDFYGSASLR